MTYEIAWLAVETRIPPRELLACDEQMYRAIRAVVKDRREASRGRR